MEKNMDSTAGCNIKLDYSVRIPASNVETFLFDEERNQIELVFRQKSNLMYACNPPRPAPDKVWKEIYGVEDGKIKLLKTIEGKHTPPQYIQEEIKFDDEK